MYGRLGIVCIHLRVILLLFALWGFKCVDGFSDNTPNVTCLNGGSVIGGRCFCAVRFEGERCENEPCLNGGVRVPDDGRCHCPFGLTGQRCETVMYCSEAGVLQNGRCKCQPQWTGIFCNRRMCYNGISFGEYDPCQCDLGYTGPFCDTAIDCVHGNITEINECKCAAGFRPPNCSSCEVGLIYSRELDSCLSPNLKRENTDTWFSSIPWWYFLIAALCILLLISLIVATVMMNKYKKKNSRVGSAEPVINGIVPNSSPQLHDQKAEV
uniref:EGF-like domain-containing protein n=1 Tax=Plectus sambesii TaxID=2011161 RepID=A0A914WVS9_9BILA